MNGSAVERAVEAWCAAALRRWPALSPDARARAEAARWPADATHGDEVVLAACALTGAPAALSTLDAEYLRPLADELRARFPGDVVDDALQSLRAKLLVGDAPRLRTWRGHDALERWLRLCALRETLSAARAPGSLPSVTPGAAGPADLDARHRDALERALAGAVAALTPTERGILKLHLFENVSVDSIARLHGVSRATMTRWLAAARQALADAVREEGRAALAVGDATLDSLARPLLSQLDVSLEALLDGKDTP